MTAKVSPVAHLEWSKGVQWFFLSQSMKISVKHQVSKQTSLIKVPTRSLKIDGPKLCSKCCLANFPILSLFSLDAAMLLMARANSYDNTHSKNTQFYIFLTFGQLWQRKPVIPCMTVSIGPPLLHAMTGFWYCMASSGTMPKCSLSGVYKTHMQFERSKCFSSLVIDVRNTILWVRDNSFASLERSVTQSRQ